MPPCTGVARIMPASARIAGVEHLGCGLQWLGRRRLARTSKRPDAPTRTRRHQMQRKTEDRRHRLDSEAKGAASPPREDTNHYSRYQWSAGSGFRRNSRSPIPPARPRRELRAASILSPLDHPAQARLEPDPDSPGEVVPLREPFGFQQLNHVIHRRSQLGSPDDQRRNQHQRLAVSTARIDQEAFIQAGALKLLRQS